MVKEIFNLINATVKASVPEIRWVDFDLGQLDAEAPPVSWPCVLVGFDDSEFVDLLQGVQQGQWMVDVKVGFRLRERTHSKAADSYRAEALDHIDILQRLHLALQAAKTGCIVSVSRVGVTTEKVPDYRIYILRYQVVAYEGPEMEDIPYKNWKTYDTKPATVDPEFLVILEPED